MSVAQRDAAHFHPGFFSSPSLSAPFAFRNLWLAPGVPTVRAARSRLGDVSSSRAPAHRNVF